MSASRNTDAKAPRAKRIGWIDWTRALGACAIVLLHVLVSTSLATELSTGRQEVYALVGIVCCRWAVPAFFMLTGYLLLDSAKRVGPSDIERYVRRMVLVLATFGLLFAIVEEAWTCVQEGGALGIGVLLSAVWDVLIASTWDHLWYVYALIGVYLVTLRLRRLQAEEGEAAFAQLTGLLFVLVLVVPTLLGGVVPHGSVAALLWNVADGITCFCVGGLIHRWRLSAATASIGVGSMLVMVVVSISGIGQGQGDRGFIFLQGSFLACLYAVFVLLAIEFFVGDAPLAQESLIAELSRDSFGVYVIHPLYIHLVLLALDPLALPPVLYECSLTAAVLIASIATTRVLRRLPVVGDIL